MRFGIHNARSWAAGRFESTIRPLSQLDLQILAIQETNANPINRPGYIRQAHRCGLFLSFGESNNLIGTTAILTSLPAAAYHLHFDAAHRDLTRYCHNAAFIHRPNERPLLFICIHLDAHNALRRRQQLDAITFAALASNEDFVIAGD